MDMRVKKSAILLAVMMSIFMAGCQNTGGNTGSPADTGTQHETENGGQAQNDREGSIIQEDDDYIYVCGSSRILKISKETKESEILWENAGCDMRRQEFLFSRGNGLLLDDRIYFIEEGQGEESGAYEKALSVVGTDGSGYERIRELASMGDDDFIAALSGKLYLSSWDEVICFEISENGMLLEGSTASKDSMISEGSTASGEGQEKQDSSLSKIMENEYYNNQYKLIENYDADGHILYLEDWETKERKQLNISADNFWVIAMDEESVYIGEDSQEAEKYVYKKVSLPDGEESIIFERKKTYWGEFWPDNLMDTVLLNGYLYYAGDENYKYYVMRRSLADPDQEEILGDAFYDRRIWEVGALEVYRKGIPSKINPDVLLFQAIMERLQVDERFAGADKINRYLAQKQEKDSTFLENEAVQYLEEEVKNGSIEFINWSYTSLLPKISYCDEKYLSFCQQESCYQGGAHDMPYWSGYTFDLQTGQRMTLKDIIRNSEEELKDIVTAHFASDIDADPEAYWGDAKDVVRESTDFDSDFYLTEDGICFYFGPYALASYSAGFQEKTIPYAEFDLKIPLGEQSTAAGTARGTGTAIGAGTAAGTGTSEQAPAAEKKEKIFASQDWGLGFGAEGSQPSGNATAEDMKPYGAYYVGDDSEKVIYLTFDCGYENGNTELILDALKKHNAPATFFVVGHFLETAPDLVKRMVDEGHAVGNHTYNHPDMASISELNDFRKELEDVEELFHEITGEELNRYYRPPQGKCNEANLDMAQELGYSTIFWSLAHVDWIQDKQPGQKESIEKLTKRIHPGAIVLLHNTSRTNGEILDELLTKWEEMGYTFEPLSNLTGQ